MNCTPDKPTFLAKSKHGNLIPVWRELLADQDTPVGAYQKLREAFRAKNPLAHTFLLESVEGGERIARYSFVGGSPQYVVRASGRRVEIECDGKTEVRENVDPLTEVKQRMAGFKPVPDPSLPRFYGGMVGYIGYDAIAQFEPPFERFFGTAQGVDLPALCRAYRVPHALVRDWTHLDSLVRTLPKRGLRVLEVRTDRKRDAAFRKELFAAAAAQLK